MHVLNFAINPYMFIPLIGMGIYGFLFYRIFTFCSESRANKWFLIYLATSIVAGMMDFLASISTTAMDATIWYLLFFVLNTLSFSSLLGFTLSFTQHHKLSDSSIVRVLLFLPSVIVSCFLLFTDLIIVHDSTKTTMIHMMWRLTEGTLRGPLYFGWIQITVISSIILFIIFSRKVQDHNVKTQSAMYAMALVVQLVVDIIILNILPLIFNIFVVPDGIVSVFFLGSILAYGIIKYNLFVINPATVASTIVDTMSDMLVVMNREGNIEYINHAITHVLGYETQDIVGKHAEILLKDQWKNVHEKLFTPLLNAEENTKIKSIFYKKNGDSVPVSIAASTVKEDKTRVAGIVCVATDISSLIELEDVTVQRNALGTIIESLKDAVLAFDKNLHVIIYNSASLSMLHGTTAEIQGRHIRKILQLFNDEVQLDILELIRHSTENNQYVVVQKNAIEVMDLSGKRIPVNMTITPVQDDAGLNLAGFIVLQDLAKEKQLEDMKLDFVSIAAHELRTPITSLRGYLSLVLDSYGAKMEADESTMLMRANISALRLSNLIDNLLSVSKIERGRITIHMKSIDWLKNVKQVISDISFQAKDKNIEITLVEPETKLPEVNVDILLIDEVLSNLISNAINYTKPGGKIAISFDNKDNSVITHIQDTGDGIAKEAIPHLFTKFYRAAQPLEQGSKGTGLGLYISKSIIEMHSGKIWVESKVGEGSTFSFSVLKA